MKSIASSRARGVLLVGFAAVLWSTSGITATIAYRRGVDALTVSFWRMAIGSAALLAVTRPSARAARVSAGDRLRLVLVATGLAGYQACFFLAVERAGVSLATLLTLGLAPVLVAAAARALHRHPLTPQMAAALGLALLGLVALVGLPAAHPAGAISGAAFAALSASGYAAVTLAGRSLGGRVDAARVSLLSFAGSALLLLLPATILAGVALPRDPVVVLAILYLGTVPTALAYRCFFLGLERTPASAAAVLTLLEPLTATVLAIPLLGERLTASGWAGGVALLCALLLAARQSGEEPDGRATAESGGADDLSAPGP